MELCRLISLVLIVIYVMPSNCFSDVAPRGLYLAANPKISAPCRPLVASFLQDLKSIVPDTPFTLDIRKGDIREGALPEGHSNQEVMILDCQAPSPTEQMVTLEDENHRHFSFHYSDKAQGFDSMDWLTFQRRHSSPTLALAQLRPPQSRSSSPHESHISQNETSLPRRKPFYKTWWFWTALVCVAGVGTGVYLANQSHHEPRLGVEIP